MGIFDLCCLNKQLMTSLSLVVCKPISANLGINVAQGFFLSLCLPLLISVFINRELNVPFVSFSLGRM